MRKEVFLAFIFVLLLAGFASAQSDESLLEKSDGALNTEIAIPDGLQVLARILFGISEEETIAFAFFVMLIAAWIFLYLLLTGFIKLIPFFEGWRVWVASLVIMLLMGISNGLEYMVAFLLWLPHFFDIFQKPIVGETFALVLAVGLLVIIYYFLTKLSKFLENESRVTENQRLGEQIHTMGEMAKTNAESIDELSSDSPR